MGNDVNNLTITGRLAEDSDLRFTPGGKAVLSFTVANGTGHGDNERTNWFKCAIWGKRAEGKLGDFLKRGQQVTIVGEISLDQREHNNKHYADLKVFVNSLALQGSSGNASNGEQSNAQPADDLDDDGPPF